jgi:hypothetical protein
VRQSPVPASASFREPLLEFPSRRCGSPARLSLLGVILLPIMTALGGGFLVVLVAAADLAGSVFLCDGLFEIGDGLIGCVTQLVETATYQSPGLVTGMRSE